MADSDSHRAGDSPEPRVALALGSGGARGYAHIGVIHELGDRGYQIVGIAGSSMGALVGGLQAAGRLDEFADWARSLTQRAILRLLDPSISAATPPPPSTSARLVVTLTATSVRAGRPEPSQSSRRDAIGIAADPGGPAHG